METLEDNERQNWAWCDLPQDIVQVIVEKLYVVDRIRFRAVCKNWFLASIHDDIQPVNKLPWIMNFRFTEIDRVCMLFEPFCRQPYIIEDKINIIDDKMETINYHATACASRSGWVLFNGDNDILLRTRSYHLYNVLTRKVIKLPDLTSQTYPTDFAAFSSVPTSTDCVFFTPLHFRDHKIRICTYSIGDESWKTHAFSCPGGWIYSADSVVYMDGSFYCFSRQGLLSSFNVDTGEWKPLTSINSPKPIWWMSIPGYRYTCKRYFLEYGGRLILAYMKNDWGVCEIFRFDWRDRVWVKIESLEGGALFLGRHRIGLGVPAGENTKMIANRVYYLRGDSPTPMFVCYGGPVSGSEERMDYGDAWDVHRLHEDLYEHRIWIDPPLFQS